MDNILNDLSDDRLREELRIIYAEDGAAARKLEKRLLVKGKEVIQYHNERDSIAVSDESLTPRFAKCINKGCQQEFDVSENKLGIANGMQVRVLADIRGSIS